MGRVRLTPQYLQICISSPKVRITHHFKAEGDRVILLIVLTYAYLIPSA